MKFHIWKPEENRWVIIDTSDGALYDVTELKGHYYVSERSPVLDYNTIIKIVIAYEKYHTAARPGCGAAVHDFEVK